MKSPTHNLTLAPDAAIDLQVHTVNSDGTWTPEALIDYAVSQQFGLIAVTDHDRPDTVAAVQQLGTSKRLPILAAVEMTTSWRGQMTDVLCYGFDPAQNDLLALGLDVFHRQQARTHMIYDNLCQKGYLNPQPDNTPQAQDFAAILEKPSAQQPHELVPFLKKYGVNLGDTSIGRLIMEAGFDFETTPIAQVIEAAHQSGAVCLIAHPGRGDEFPLFDENLLDELREDVPIDGIEAYYPKHAPEQIEMYLAYAQKHDLLVSSGSDSHGADKTPIKYRAELSRSLLERVGIQVS